MRPTGAEQTDAQPSQSRNTDYPHFGNRTVFFPSDTGSAAGLNRSQSCLRDDGHITEFHV